MNLQDVQQLAGGILAPDGIPLHFGNQNDEYYAALEGAVLMDRSHEGRFETHGRDRFELIQRISTNDLLNMDVGEGRPTILTSPTGRIIDRLVVYNGGKTGIVTTEPGRGQVVREFLQRQIFFNDEVRIQDLSTTTKQFVLHGPNADAVIREFSADAGKKSYLEFIDAKIADASVMLLKRKPLVGTHWVVIVPNEQAVAVWQALLAAGEQHGLKLAGSLTYNMLRIKAGRPAAGRELSSDYIPLEAGLWDEVSFKKGCYTGQEIIARMESRNRLAKTMVKLSLTQMVEAPATLMSNGKEAGTLTSSVLTPDGSVIGIGFVKIAYAEIGQSVAAGDQQIPAQILAFAGATSPMLESQT